MPIDKQKTLKLLEELVAIDSVNPTLALAAALPSSGQAGRPGASGEQRAAERVREFLRANGIAAELEEAAAGRPNVVATIGPANVKPALMIVAHIDTVGAGDMREPFTPRVRDGKMHGRGALDIKSGVAAMCAAATEIVREGAPLARPVIIAGVVDEECNSIGTEALLRRGHTAEAAIVLEPTDLKLVIAH
ncbi:MAG TPA: M20/M25/M40 family metallo-hydrolase, partial [Candidatus Acidoferrales bacterium]|nr:M20/M25/M40 family metallo-hydrolase [Candidatus Acidoferrales bacterium]